MKNIPLSFLPGILQNMGVAWRLMQMPTVSPWVKFLLPFLSLLYYFSPIDLMPGLPIDDLFLVLIICPQLMIHFSPPEAVAAARQGGTYQTTAAEPDNEAIEAPWQVVEQRKSANPGDPG